jgi:hypothetical protein
MKQSRKNCAAIYTEEEYEELVLEAYWRLGIRLKWQTTATGLIVFIAGNPTKTRILCPTIGCSTYVGHTMERSP